MKVSWSTSKNGYIIYGFSNSVYPSSINGKPIIGVYDSSFRNRDQKYSPIINLFFKLFQKSLYISGSDFKEVGEYGSGGRIYDYKSYKASLLNDRIQIEAACKAECYYLETFVINSCVEVKFDNHTIYKDMDEHDEEDHIKTGVEGYSYFLSSQIGELLWYVIQLYGLTDCFFKEIKKYISKDKTFKKDITDFKNFVDKVCDVNNIEVTFLDEKTYIKYKKPRFFKGELTDYFNLQVSSNNKEIYKSSYEQVKISNVYVMKNEFGLEYKYIDIGEYPQTLVTNKEIILKLNKLKEDSDSKIVILDNKKYIVTEYKENEYSLSSLRYYEIEPIRYRVIKDNDYSMLLLSEKIIDFYPDKFWGDGFKDLDFIKKTVLSNYTQNVIQNAISYMLHKELDYSSSGLNIDKEYLKLLEHIESIVSTKYDDDYKNRSPIGFSLFNGDLDNDFGLLYYFFNYIEPIRNYVSNFFEINRFMHKLSIENLSDENHGFGKDKTTLQVLSTDYASRLSSSLLYNGDWVYNRYSGYYYYVDGKDGDIKKSNDEVKLRMGARPILLLNKEMLVKTSYYLDEINRWETYKKQINIPKTTNDDMKILNVNYDDIEEPFIVCWIFDENQNTDQEDDDVEYEGDGDYEDDDGDYEYDDGDYEYDDGDYEDDDGDYEDDEE